MSRKNKNRFLKLLIPVATSLLQMAALFVSVNAAVASFTNNALYNSAAGSMGTTKIIDFAQRDNNLPMTSPDRELTS